ncbi:Fc.00g040010.m01.CDS01 [Cosmosporella sp. VM-42]
MDSEKSNASEGFRLGRFFGNDSTSNNSDEHVQGPSKWSMGVLNDKQTVEVPGSVLLLASHRNEPLGLRNAPARTSHSSIPVGFPVDIPMTPGGSRPMPMSPPATGPVNESDSKKKTEDGAIILEPQPEDSVNDPLNWPSWRRDLALLSLGFYCMVGGGTTPIIAAGFTDVAHTYDVEVETVALTTGLYMMGLGIGSVIASPTAILYGKRPVYLVSAVLFIGTSLWAAWSPTFNSLLAARVFQGIAVSPVECLPSATIAEIFFLHERAFRIGIYTLLLLGGKNLVPLVSAAIIGRFGWRWVFWIVAMVVAACFFLLFLFVPETFWDRTPHHKPRSSSKRPNFLHRLSSRHTPQAMSSTGLGADDTPHTPASRAGRNRDAHVDFAPEANTSGDGQSLNEGAHHRNRNLHVGFAESDPEKQAGSRKLQGDRIGSVIIGKQVPAVNFPEQPEDAHQAQPPSSHDPTSYFPRNSISASRDNHLVNSPYYNSTTGSEANVNYYNNGLNLDNEKIPASKLRGPPKIQAYTHNLRHQEAQSFTQQLRPYHGRLNNDKWLKVMMRPFILFAYPAVLWSSAVYACSIGWLIVVSESMAMIYRDPKSYNFDALETGLIYISPFVGGILGTGVAGKISDIIVKAMARRNGGLYEPEFRLVMAIPILITTCIGLIGFGWSAEEKDHWMVPTAFFGIISFGCSLGSTTAITFCVDSYRQYAGEALVTLNFTKNIFHGLVFSLFVTHWLTEDGPKSVYMWIGIIQLLLMLCTIPMYLYGKRCRMWTVRRNLMEKF